MQILEVGSGPHPLIGKNILHIDMERRGGLDGVCDGHSLPYVDGCFDIVYCSHTLEHVLNPYEFIRELARVAKIGVVFSVPSSYHYSLFRNSPNHIYGWSKFNLEALLRLVFPRVQVRSNYRLLGRGKLSTIKTYIVSLLTRSQNELTAVCYKD